MLTDEALRKAFTDTNTEEPLSEGWPGLERFAREVERLTWIDTLEGSDEFNDKVRLAEQQGVDK